MNHAEYTRRLDAALESGFRATGLSAFDVEFAKLDAEDKAAAIEAVLCDESEALEHFGNCTFAYAMSRGEKWAAAREAKVRTLVKLLESAVKAHTTSAPDDDVYASLGLAVATLMSEEVIDTIDARLSDIAIEWDESEAGPGQHAKAEMRDQFRAVIEQARTNFA